MKKMSLLKLVVTLMLSFGAISSISAKDDISFNQLSKKETEKIQNIQNDYIKKADDLTRKIQSQVDKDLSKAQKNISAKADIQSIHNDFAKERDEYIKQANEQAEATQKEVNSMIEEAKKRY